MPARAADPAPAAHSLRLAEVVAALSLATDLGTGHPLERSLRACLLGLHFGAELGYDTATLRDIYYTALLRWAGCTADTHRAEIFGDEITLGPQIDSVELWNAAEMIAFLQRTLHQTPQLDEALTTGIQRSQTAAIAGCEIAQNIAARLGFGPTLHAALGQLFERWDGQGVPGRAQGEAVQPAVRVMHIVMDAELFHRLGGPEAAVSVVRRRAGGFYDPDLAERFCRAAPRLFSLLDTPSAWEAALAAEPGERPQLQAAALDDALRAIGDFTDLRSPQRLGHTSAVSQLAEAAARRLGLPADEVTRVRRAGLVHDVGLAGLPKRLGEHPGPLTESEWERLRLHPYYTERILFRPRALAGLSAPAAQHHERLDGSGYHRGLAAAQLAPAARVLAAADVWCALRAPRPHRPAFEPEAAARELRREVTAGRLDSEVVYAVLAAAGQRVGRAARTQVAGLTEREIEVLRLVALGQSNKQIAASLTLAPATVDHHIRHIYAKLGVATRPAATMFALQHHLLSA